MSILCMSYIFIPTSAGDSDVVNLDHEKTTISIKEVLGSKRPHQRLYVFGSSSGDNICQIGLEISEMRLSPL